MVAVNVQPIEFESMTGHGEFVRADVYLPRGRNGRFPVLFGASPYQKPHPSRLRLHERPRTKG